MHGIVWLHHLLSAYKGLSWDCPLVCRKYGDPRIVLEVAYNLIYSWHRFCCDADCCLFLKMLMGMFTVI